jgi:putative ABC transport system permease protein
MNIIKIAWSNLKDKKMSTSLSILLMSFGIAIISLLLLINQQLGNQFKKNINGVDMVVGAKGSPLQLILSSIYQIDSPTGNIPFQEVNQLKMNPMVKTVIPLAMGDNYKSFRIVGSTQTYIEHYKGVLEEGKTFNNPLEVVIGQNVKSALQLKVGDKFSGTHGFDQNGDVHEDDKYIVVGILAKNNSVLDNLLVTPLSSIWELHHHEDHAEAGHNEAEHDHDHEPVGQEITSMLVKFRTPMGMLMLPRQINANTKLQTAVPAIEVNRLLDLLGIGFDTLQYLALAIILISAISVFVSLYNSLKERKYEMALMLSMGANRFRLFLILLLEGLIIALIGSLIGVLLSRVGMWFLNNGIKSSFHFDLNQFGILKDELYLFLGAIIISLLAAALPSLTIYKINISKTLAQD